MSSSMNIHRVTQVRARSVHYDNANSVGLYFSTADGGEFALTLFGLPTEAAEHLSNSLRDDAQTEADIRADERAKVTARLATLIGEPV